MKKSIIAVLALFGLCAAALSQSSGPISGLDPITTTATGDLAVLVDVSDTTASVNGTNKKITVANLLALLHGNLDVNSNAIVSSSAGDIALTPDTTGNVVLDGLYWPQSDGTEGQWLTTDGSTQIAFSSNILELQDLDFDPVNSEVLVSTGALTLTQTYTQVGAESGTADTIDSIAWTGADNGAIAILYPTSGDTLTFANGTTGGDNLDLGADVVLDSVNERLILQFNGTNWVQLANSANIETVDDTETWIIAASDETSDLTTTGNPKVTFRAPYACTITGVKASVTTAPVGATLIVDINDGGTSIMTTNKLDILTTATIDDGTATLTDTALAEDAVVTIDIDQIGSSTAGAGLKVYIEHTRD